MTMREDMVNGHAIGHGGLHLHPRRQCVRVRLQLLQPVDRRGRGRDPLPPADPPRRPARRHRDRARAVTAATGCTTSWSPSATRSSRSSSAAARRSAGPSSDEPDRRHGRDPLDSRHDRRDPDARPEAARGSSSSGSATPCARVYAHVPHYTRAFDAAGVTPDDLTSLADLARFPFTTKADLRANYPFGMFAVPREQVSRVHASSGTTGKPDRRRLHRRRPRHLGGADGPLDPRGRRSAGRRRARRLRLRAVHRRARRPLRRRAARLHRGPGQRRDDRAAGAADRRLPAAGHHGDAVVLPVDPRRARGPGRRPEGHQPRDRHLRRRAVDRRDAARRRGAHPPQGGRHLRAQRGDGPGRQPGVGGDPGRPARLGGPLPARDRRPADPGAGAPTARRASWCSPA